MSPIAWWFSVSWREHALSHWAGRPSNSRLWEMPSCLASQPFFFWLFCCGWDVFSAFPSDDATFIYWYFHACDMPVPVRSVGHVWWPKVFEHRIQLLSRRGWCHDRVWCHQRGSSLSDRALRRWWECNNNNFSRFWINSVDLLLSSS